jgi:hypothetical protein
VRAAGRGKATGACRWLGAMVVRDSVLRVYAGYSTYSIPRDPTPADALQRLETWKVAMRKSKKC